jgi:hypothetical protein
MLSNSLAQIVQTAEAQEAAELEVATLTEDLKTATNKLRRISEEEFPELLDSLEMTEDITVGGFRVKLTEKLFGSIPVASREEAMEWLEANGHGDIVKRQILIEFGKDEEKWAREFIAECRARDKKLNMQVKRTVHPQTLQAWCREMVADGEDFDMELFGVYFRKWTKITRIEELIEPF